MLQNDPSLPVTSSGGGDRGCLAGGGLMGVASMWGCGSLVLGLTGVELLYLLINSVEGATLSSSKLLGCIVVPNFLLGLGLAGVPVM